MKAAPVLLITHDDALWQHWRALDSARWAPARGRTMADLTRWREQKRELVVIDASLPRLPAWNDTAWSSLGDGIRLVVASSRPTDDQGTKALAAGMSGYCHTHAPVDSLAQVLDVVASGGVWMGRSLVSRLLKLVDERTPTSGNWYSSALTDRENAVTLRAAHGESNAEIAEALGITERTVKAHLSAVFEKLGVSDRLQLALKVHGIAR